MKVPRLPRRIVLGPKHAIPVVQLPHAEYVTEADEEDEPPEHRSGAHFDIGQGVMYLDASLPLARRWRAYRHELMHALIDIALEETGGI